MIYLAKILAIVLSVLLTALVLKSCLLDKISFSNHRVIVKFLLVALFAIAMGVPVAEATTVGGLMGTKLVLNEMVAYMDLTSPETVLSAKSFLIASFALCSFGNFGSIAILLGGIGELAPNQRKNLARLGVRALICGTLTCYMSATIAGILVK
jgi:CNT family concentrative nucleoside transporter